MKNFGLILLIFFLVSCFDEPKKNTTDYKNTTGDKEDISAKELEINDNRKIQVSNEEFAQSQFKKWEKELLQKSIFDYVVKKDCNDFDKMLALYDEGKYPMHADSIKFLNLDYNNDNLEDYLITYKLTNCVKGSGWSRDFLLVVSNTDGNYDFDKKAINSIKQTFLEFVKNKIGEEDTYANEENGFIETKGLVFNKTIGNKILGNYYIQGNGANCCPEINGNFTIDMGKNILEFSDPARG